MLDRIPENVRSISLIEYGAMSNDVYDNFKMPINYILLENGWERVETRFEKIYKGFRARFYIHTSGHAVLAYRGTDFTEWSNLKADGSVILKQHSVFLEYAEKAYDSICKEDTPPMAVVGHSLCGYLAQYVSIMARHKVVGDPDRKDSHLNEHGRTKEGLTDYASFQKCVDAQGEGKKTGILPKNLPYAITFNPPHVGGLVTRLNFIIPSADYPYILNCRVGGDVVSELGWKVGWENKLDNPFPLHEGKVSLTLPSWDAHKMQYVMGKLLAQGAVQKEMLGLSILPVNR